MPTLYINHPFKNCSQWKAVQIREYAVVWNCIHRDKLLWALGDVEFRGLQILCPQYETELESRQKSISNFLLFFQKISPSETDFCPTWGAAAPLSPPPTLMQLTQHSILFRKFIYSNIDDKRRESVNSFDLDSMHDHKNIYTKILVDTRKTA